MNTSRSACEYVAERLRQLAPDIAMGRVIVAHLGSGASMCALAGGRSGPMCRALA
jgi:acetate kinase